jgi:lysophospholipase L1-like esterase
VKGLLGRRAGFLALAILGVASVAGNVLLGNLWVAEVRKGQVARLDPVGLAVYAAERAAPTLPGLPGLPGLPASAGQPGARPVLVLFGDSRAAMWPTPGALSAYTVVNRGIGYQTTAQIAQRIDADVAPLRPAVVVLEAGVNDLKTIAELPERRAQVVADCEANLRSIVQRCKAVAGAVVVVSIFDIGDVPIWRRPFWSDDIQAAVREVNAFLPTLAGDGVVLLEAGAVLDDRRGRIAPAFQFDFLHLDPAGYAALDTKLVPLVASLPHMGSSVPSNSPARP